ncbi:MAG: hypothetical protein R3283_04595 [Balneolaceae bacterium]|nr:hypothetical protein [Balneolaceae bacterium]
MKSSIHSILFISILSFTILSCQSEPIEVEFEEINDQDLAIFRVYNHTDQDYLGIDFEVTYLDDRKEIILIDTVSYPISLDQDSIPQVFLRANGQTIFVQRVPENTVTTTGRTISSIPSDDL